MSARTHLEKRRVHSAQAEDVEHEPDDIDQDDGRKLLRRLEVHLWNLDLGRDERSPMKEHYCDDELDQEEKQG